MKEDTVPVAIKVCYVLVAICALGLVLAALGILFRQDPLYYVGLLMAAPLFVIVLPLCILLIVLALVLSPLTGIRELMRWRRRPTGNNDKNDNQPARSA